MKRNDIALLVLIISLSLITSYFLLSTLMVKPSATRGSVEVVEPISAELTEPSEKVFNDKAIDPTVVIEIGNPANQQPFQQR